MKITLTLALMFGLLNLFGCREPTKKNSEASEISQTEELTVIDSVTVELEKTDTEIQEKIKALEDALKDL